MDGHKVLFTDSEIGCLLDALLTRIRLLERQLEGADSTVRPLVEEELAEARRLFNRIPLPSLSERGFARKL